MRATTWNGMSGVFQVSHHQEIWRLTNLSSSDGNKEKEGGKKKKISKRYSRRKKPLARRRLPVLAGSCCVAAAYYKSCYKVCRSTKDYNKPEGHTTLRLLSVHFFRRRARCQLPEKEQNSNDNQLKQERKRSSHDFEMLDTRARKVEPIIVLPCV
ncbi:hypothetical protein OUZ56_031920 [Daphnia magna]|uniref:Uncharacterized protein n=1 Tax=Daphnia magna TaxID=35525 RepID=A0ABQ9ZWD2_9CRUS|nr:hypothetical protein OUZ56_031920 [Daphnia magna]